MGKKNKIDIFIYLLLDPRDGAIRYVGATIHPEKRMWEHLHDLRAKCHRTDWIKFLLRHSLEPQMWIIEITDEKKWEKRERSWIKFYRKVGCDLTNSTDGGEGVREMSKEIKAKIGATRSARYSGKNHPLFGKKMSLLTRARIAAAHLGLEQTEETLNKIIRQILDKEANRDIKKSRKGIGGWNKGRKHTPESIQKMSDAKKGKKQSAESNAKRSESLRGENNPFYGKTHTVESRALISAAHMGRIVTNSIRNKISNTTKGRPKSAEHIAKIKAGVLRFIQNQQSNQTT
jgi:predicted GIY-YIG superfamily endonuclease